MRRISGVEAKCSHGFPLEEDSGNRSPHCFQCAEMIMVPVRKEEKSAMPVDRDLRIEKMAQGFEMILEALLGLDLEDDPHMKDTPRRAARAWYDEICRGLTHNPPKITTFPSEVDEMILLQDIPVRSICSHHLLPFLGTATVGYVPGRGKILGLSKLSRIVDYWARRPQVQEELTSQIADHIAGLVTEPERVWKSNVVSGSHPAKGGVGVMIRANHLCMAMRGVSHEGEMITSALRGVFLSKPEARAEFLELARVGK